MTIEVKFSSIYDAAHTRLPAQAADFAQHAGILGDALGPAAVQAQAAGAYAVSGNITALGEELFHRLRIMVRTLNESAIALDRIADDFVETDDAVVSWTKKHQSWIESHPEYRDRPDVPPLPRLPRDRADT